MQIIAGIDASNKTKLDHQKLQIEQQKLLSQIYQYCQQCNEEDVLQNQEQLIQFILKLKVIPYNLIYLSQQSDKIQNVLITSILKAKQEKIFLTNCLIIIKQNDFIYQQIFDYVQNKQQYLQALNNYIQFVKQQIQDKKLKSVVEFKQIILSLCNKHTIKQVFIGKQIYQLIELFIQINNFNDNNEQLIQEQFVYKQSEELKLKDVPKNCDLKEEIKIKKQNEQIQEKINQEKQLQEKQYNDHIQNIQSFGQLVQDLLVLIPRQWLVIIVDFSLQILDKQQNKVIQEQYINILNNIYLDKTLSFAQLYQQRYEKQLQHIIEYYLNYSNVNLLIEIIYYTQKLEQNLQKKLYVIVSQFYNKNKQSLINNIKIMNICQHDDKCVKCALEKNNQNLLDQLPQDMLVALMYLTAQNYIQNPMETNTHILYQLANDKLQQNLMSEEEKLMLLCFIFIDKDFLNIVDISEINQLIDYIFDKLDQEQYNVYIKLLQNTIVYICQNYMTPELIINIIIKLLNVHFLNQSSLEDTRILKVQKCISIWNIIESIAEFITDFQNELDLSQILYGDILPLSSNLNPVCLHVKLQEQNSVLQKRKEMYNLTLSQVQPVIVDSLYDSKQYMKLLLGQQISSIKDFKKIALLQLIFERFIQSTIFDFNYDHQIAAQKAIQLIIENLGKEYKNRISFMIEIHKIKTLPDIPQFMYYVFNRIQKEFEDIEQYQSFLEVIFDKTKMENNIQNGQAILINILSSICKYIPFQCNIYQQIIEFIEDITSQYCKINSLLAQSLQQIWNNILFDKNYDIEINTFKIENKIIKNMDQFVLEYLIPRYEDTIQYSNQDYPSMCYCLSGIISQRGISYLLKENDIIDDLILKLIRSKNENQQIQGLIVLYNIMSTLKQLFDPYIKIIAGDLIMLHQTENQEILSLVQLCFDQILHNISQYGLFQLVKIIDFSLQQQDSIEMINGGLDIVLQIMKNTGKIPMQTFKQIIQKLLPDVLPLLQDLVSHENKNIAQKTQDILLISVDQITNIQIKQMGKNIVECYNYSSNIRNLLSDFNEIVFQNKIDRISLILLIPLCLKIMNQVQSTLYASATDKSQNLHIKQIAATSLAILSQVSNAQEFEQQLDKIVQSLINNLSDTNDDIRNSCVNSLIKVVTKYTSYSNKLLQDLIQQLINQDNQMNIAERKGKIQAIVGLAYLVGQQDKLIEMLDSMPLNGLLITFYLPQYVIQNIQNSPELREQKQQFVDNYFEKLVHQLFQCVELLKEEYHDFIIKLARQLFTSFAKEKQIVQLSIKSITNYILDENEKIRQMCIILVGDIMSEIGSEVQGSIKESEEIQNVKKLLSQVYVSGIAEAKTKVFIPEKSIAYAVSVIGQEAYDNLCSCIFILKCEEDDNVRRQAVNMWKLIIVKPQQIIDRFYGNLLDNMILAKKSQIVFEEKTIESYLLQAHNSAILSFEQQIINKLKAAIDQQDKFITRDLLDLLAIISQQKKLDQQVQIELFQLVPQCLKTFVGDSDITSKSMTILCSQENNQQQIRELIQPQIDQIEQCQTQEQLQQLVEQISIIIQNNSQLITDLIKESLQKGEQEQNYYIFAAQLVVQMFENDDIDDWIHLIINNIQQRAQQILSQLNQQSSKQLQQTINGKQFEQYNTCLIMAKVLYGSENDEIIQLTNEAVCQSIITNVAEDQITNTLLLCIGIIYRQQNVQVISSVLQSIFTNVQKQQYNQIFAIAMSSLYIQYKHLQQDSIELEAYLELLFQQMQNYMYGIQNATVLLQYDCQIQDMITLLCTIQSYVQKNDKNYFAQTKMIACNIFMQIILTILQTYCQQQNKKGEEYIFLNTTYKILSDKKCIQANKYSVGMIGRIVLLIKQQNILQSSYLQIIQLLAKFVDIHQFEPIIRGELEKYCLINANKQIEENTAQCLIYLYRQTQKPINSIKQLVEKLTKEILENNLNIDIQLEVLQNYLAYHHEQIKSLGDIQKIQEIINQLPQSDNEKLNEQMIKLQGVLVNKLLEIDPVKAEILLYNNCFQQTSTIEEEVKQLVILSSIFQYGNESIYDKIYKLITHCLENLQIFRNAEQQDENQQINFTDNKQPQVNFTKALQNKLEDIISAQQVQICVKVAEIITNCLQIFTTHKFAQTYQKINKQFVILFAKSIQICQKYEQIDTYNSLLICIQKLGDLEDTSIKRSIGLITMQFINDCFMNQDTFQLTQDTAILFYKLRYDKSFAEELFQILSQSNTILVDQMKQRVNQISKAIKQGKL